LSLALLPVWVPVLRRYRGGLLFAGAILLTMIGGAFLTAIAASDHQIDWSELAGNYGLLLSLIAGVGLVLWAREHMSDAHVAQWFGAGIILGVAAGAVQLEENPWKFGFSVGVTVFVLALAQRSGQRWLEIGALLLLAGVSAVTDSRSQFAILVFAAVLVAWQIRPKGRSIRRTTVSVLLGLAILGAIVFNLVQALALEGTLGQDAQLRSTEQIDSSGSLLLGGRPELAATFALFEDRPEGFGPGTVPNTADLHVAQHGMESIGYSTDNSYFARYMFGKRFEVHSVVGDLWARFGIAGLILSAVILGIIVVGLARNLAKSTASGVMVYAIILTAWNLPFSPLYSSLTILILAVGLSLPARAAPDRPSFAPVTP
jgi:hypothetical protein